MLLLDCCFRLAFLIGCLMCIISFSRWTNLGMLIPIPLSCHYTWSLSDGRKNAGGVSRNFHNFSVKEHCVPPFMLASCNAHMTFYPMIIHSTCSVNMMQTLLVTPIKTLHAIESKIFDAI